MQSNDMPATTASSSSGNIVAPTAGSASGNAPLPATAAPQVEPLSHPTNTSVVAAITQLNLLPRTLHNHAKDASETRKAEVQSWLEHHQEEFDRRVSRLAPFIGLDANPSENADLRELLQPYPVPAELLAPETQPAAPEASSSKRKRDDSPGPDSPGPAAGKGKEAVRDTAGEEQAGSETGNKKAKTVSTAQTVSAAQAEAQDDDDDEENREDEGENREDEGEDRKKTNKSVCGAVAYDAVKKQYAELRCTVCGTNTSKDGSFLKGVRGFQTHYRHIHNETLTPQEIFARFQVRTFTEDEAKMINKAGGPTVNKHEPTAEDDDEQAGPAGGAGGENDDEDEE